jgi:hypothetical protein
VIADFFFLAPQGGERTEVRGKLFRAASKTSPMIFHLGISTSLGHHPSPARREYSRPETVWIIESNLIE